MGPNEYYSAAGEFCVGTIHIVQLISLGQQVVNGHGQYIRAAVPFYNSLQLNEKIHRDHFRPNAINSGWLIMLCHISRSIKRGLHYE